MTTVPFFNLKEDFPLFSLFFSIFFFRSLFLLSLPLARCNCLHLSSIVSSCPVHPPRILSSKKRDERRDNSPPAALALASLKKMSQALEVLRHYDETANAHEAYSSLITFPVSSFKFCRRRATTATTKFVSVSFRRLI